MWEAKYSDDSFDDENEAVRTFMKDLLEAKLEGAVHGMPHLLHFVVSGNLVLSSVQDLCGPNLDSCKPEYDPYSRSFWMVALPTI